MIAAANQGENLYKQFCGACHGPDGKGVAGGAFPPLAGSEWLKGDGNRAAQILLHGLTGPIEVKGKTYNLMMPPQAALNNNQKVEVLNYIRIKWGNDNKPYTLADLEKAIKKSEKRTTPWTAKELLKLYPLPGKKGVLNNLIMTTYHGKWNKLPDFSKIKGAAVEEEHAGFLSLKRINRKINYGIVWKGDIEIEKDGEYHFEIDSDDLSRLSINGKKIAEINSPGPIGRAKKGKMTLPKGTHEVTFEYVQGAGHTGLSARMRHKSTKKWTMLSDQAAKKPKPPMKVIDLTPTDGKVRIYNNFITGSTPRGFAVGFPQGKNYSFSTQNCSLDLLWSGKFISGGRHWTGRGQGNQPPMEESFVSASNGKPVWLSGGKPATVQFKGYKMDDSGNPTLRYTVDGVAVEDKFTPTDSGFSRIIKTTSSSAKSLSLIVKEGFGGEVGETSVAIPGAFTAEIKGGKLSSENNSAVVKDIKGNNTTLTILYKW